MKSFYEMRYGVPDPNPGQSIGTTIGNFLSMLWGLVSEGASRAGSALGIGPTQAETTPSAGTSGGEQIPATDVRYTLGTHAGELAIDYRNPSTDVIRCADGKNVPVTKENAPSLMDAIAKDMAGPDGEIARRQLHIDDKEGSPGRGQGVVELNPGEATLGNLSATIQGECRASPSGLPSRR